MMTIPAGAGALDYSPCRYGTSRSIFRGPERDLTRPYIAMLGGSSTFGKHVAQPFPALVESALGHPVANLGGLNAGPDFYLSTPATLGLAARSRVAVLQVTGAEAMSNPFYTVHGRRNDRFLAATTTLRDLYPEADFTEIHFTRHLLMVLHRTDPLRFRTVVSGLKANWLARMRALLGHLPQDRILLWLADTPPPAIAVDLNPAFGPLLVDAVMLAELAPDLATLVEAVPSAAAWAEGADRVSFCGAGAAPAISLPGSAVHAEVAALLIPIINELFGNEKGPLARPPKAER